MLSPLAQYFMTLACSMAAERISSVVSVSVALAEPSARRGRRPRVMRHCLAGASPLHVQVRLSVVNTGTATVSTGTRGRYLATSLAVEPPVVHHHIKGSEGLNE
jgi:hypothetical protein